MKTDAPALIAEVAFDAWLAEKTRTRARGTRLSHAFTAGWNAARFVREAEAAERYLIWSNEHHCWWRAKASGYTRDVAAAGRYGREEALSLARMRDWRDGVPGELVIAERDAVAAGGRAP